MGRRTHSPVYGSQRDTAIVAWCSQTSLAKGRAAELLYRGDARAEQLVPRRPSSSAVALMCRAKNALDLVLARPHQSLGLLALVHHACRVHNRSQISKRFAGENMQVGDIKRRGLGAVLNEAETSSGRDAAQLRPGQTRSPSGRGAA